MTRRVAAVLAWLSLVAVVVVAGGHAVYYLLEWEWVRAQIAAIAFVAALVVGATLLLLSRLRDLERRLDRLVAGTDAGAPAAGASTALDPEPRPDFAWLSGTHWSALALPLLALTALGPPRSAVFVPVFLATGLAVSVVASGVERLAARRSTVGAGRAAPAPRPLGLGAAIAVPLTGAVVIAAVIGGLWVTAHYRAEPVGPGTTTMTLQVMNNGPTTTDADVAETVGRYCVLNAGVDVRFAGVTPGPRDSTLLRLRPLLDDDAQRRFAGCLEDAILEWHQLEVLDVTLAPR